MNDIATAIKESNERKARLNQALQEKPAEIEARESAAYHDRMDNMGAELAHIQKHLEPHGLTIATLLRTVAKQFHGIDVPVYVEPKED